MTLMQTQKTFIGKSPSSIIINRNNNFNLLRFILALLVILAHSPELIDGNRQREILTRLFGTLSFGELAVRGFFILSGFLIVQSWQHNPDFFDFIKKRVLRIYPAFIIASLVSAFVIGPLGSDSTQYFAQFNMLHFIKGVFLLSPPNVPPVFEGQPHPYVNGSMWTIKYEFICYLLVAILGFCGIFKSRYFWLILTGSVLTLFLVVKVMDRIYHNDLFFLTIDSNLKQFIPFFLAGGCFYLFHDRIRYKKSWIIIAGLILLLCMLHWNTAQLAFIIFGAYILFGIAFSKLSFLEQFRKLPDVSYGVYLYGWPIQKLLLWYYPSLSPWILFFLACGLSCICGLLSWHFVERPLLHLNRNQEKKASG